MHLAIKQTRIGFAGTLSLTQSINLCLYMWFSCTLCTAVICRNGDGRSDCPCRFWAAVEVLLHPSAVQASSTKMKYHVIKNQPSVILQENLSGDFICHLVRNRYFSASQTSSCCSHCLSCSGLILVLPLISKACCAA